MLITPHATTGALVGLISQNPVLGFFLGVVSHFVLDALPHFDQGTLHNYQPGFIPTKLDYLIVYFDIIISIILFVWMFNASGNNISLLSGVVGGVGIDAVCNPLTKNYIIDKPVLKQIYWLERKCHFKLNPKYWYLGILIQLGIIIGGILCLVKLFSS